MDVTELDEALLHYCNRGVADSTRRTYRLGVNRYLSFCCAFGVSTPFPVSELMLCYFITSLAREGIAPATIKTYLAAVRHAQIIQGHQVLRDSSALPRLSLIQKGICRERAESSPAHSPNRLPITLPLLRLLRPPEGSLVEPRLLNPRYRYACGRRPGALPTSHLFSIAGIPA